MLPTDHILARLASLSKTAKYSLDFKYAFKEQFGRSFTEYANSDRSAKLVLDDVRSKNDIFYHWSKIAEVLYDEIDIRSVIKITEGNAGLVVGADEQKIFATITRLYSVPPPEYARDKRSALWTPEIGSPLFNVFFSAFLSALQASFGQIVHEVGHESAEVLKNIEIEESRSPFFREMRGRLSYYEDEIEAGKSKEFSEYKRIALDRCQDLVEKVKKRENEQPDLKSRLDRYEIALKAVRKNKGVFSLFITGAEIESLVRVKESAPPDPERNVRLDADLLVGIQSLMLTHAMLVSLFKEFGRFSDVLDRYREQLTSVDALRDRIFDPVLDRFAAARSVFDEETIGKINAIRDIDIQERAQGLPPSQQNVSAKLTWVRAAMAAIARVALRNGQEVARLARDTAVKELASDIAKHPLTLTAAVAQFLRSSAKALGNLADRLPSGFGWIKSLLSVLGIPSN